MDYGGNEGAVDPDRTGEEDIHRRETRAARRRATSSASAWRRRRGRAATAGSTEIMAAAGSGEERHRRRNASESSRRMRFRTVLFFETAVETTKRIRAAATPGDRSQTTRPSSVRNRRPRWSSERTSPLPENRSSPRRAIVRVRDARALWRGAALRRGGRQAFRGERESRAPAVACGASVGRFVSWQLQESHPD